VRQTVTNSGDTPAPYGAGCHPYLSGGGGKLDGWTLEVPAATRLVMDGSAIPVGREPVSGDFDFRTPRAIGAARLDTAYTDLERDSGGVCTVRVGVEGGGVELWLDATHPYVMVFSGDTLAPPRRRHGLAVEPMTCAPNAFNSGEGLIILQPGETFTSAWGIRAVR